jgi:hypothetical protein
MLLSFVCLQVSPTVSHVVGNVRTFMTSSSLFSLLDRLQFFPFALATAGFIFESAAIISNVQCGDGGGEVFGTRAGASWPLQTRPCVHRDDLRLALCTLRSTCKPPGTTSHTKTHEHTHTCRQQRPIHGRSASFTMNFVTFNQDHSHLGVGM